MTLKRKMLLYILPVMLIALVSVTFWGAKSLRDAVLDTTREEAVSQTKNLTWLIKKRMIQVRVSPENDFSLDHILKDLLNEGERLSILDERGNLSYVASDKALAFYSRVLYEENQELVSKYTRVDDRIFLTVASTFDLSNREWTLNRTIDVTYLDKIYGDYIRKTILFNLVLLVVVFVVVIGSANQISEPLMHMVADIEDIQSGSNHKRLEFKDTEEFVLLGNAFNDLMDKLEDRLGRLVKERDIRQDFVDSLRHEMRTPLTSILGYSDLLRRNVLDEEDQAQSSETIHREAERLQALSDVLLYGLMAKGELAFSHVSISKLSEDVRKSYRIRLDEKEINLKMVICIEEVEAHPILLMQAVGNLIDNAIKASEYGGEVELHFDNDGIRVVDFGKASTQSIQTQPVETIRPEGFGIGLHIVREIAEAHKWHFVLKDGEISGKVAGLYFNKDH